MAVERQVISANIKKVKVKEFLLSELERAGIGDIDIQRTPMDTRVIIYAQRPGIVIGKKGTTIKAMTETLRDEYGLDNPQIEVNDLGVPALSAQVMAKNIASSLERGYNFRRAAYSALRDIMNAGAIGAQITLSGKLTGRRSRMVKFMKGYIKHCGEPAETLVLKGFAEAAPKLGRIGVKVKILPPDTHLPDDIRIVPVTEETEKPAEVEAAPAVGQEVTAADVKAPSEAKAKETKVGKKAKTPSKVKKPKIKVEGDLLDRPAKEIVKAIKGMEPKELASLLEAETKGKNRKTVIEGIKKLIKE
ncbi:MAG: 30S ribosomal protein S3 [Candidatus Hydrothermarchaeales archaeon]